MKILVIGGTGLVGTNILELASQSDIEMHGTFHESTDGEASIALDKADFEQTLGVVRELTPDAIIDTAAYHDVDSCEQNREYTWNVNATGTRNVAVAANENDAHLIYLSTDYVFPGNPEEAPYTESDPVAPLNYYAESKYAGERAARIADTSTILRPSVIYGLANSNFVTWALGELEDGNEISIVNDQISTPTYAPDLARACLEISKERLTGLYHSTGPTSLSRFEFTVTMAEVYGYDTDLVTPITTEEFGQEAPRPNDSSLDSSELYEELEWGFRSPKAAFEEMKTRMS